MAERAGAATPAAMRAALAARWEAAVNADRTLTGVLRDAHAAALATHRRLTAIEAELDARAGAAASTGDAALGARELQRFLLASQHELIAIITEARADAAARRSALDALRAGYRGDAAAPLD